MLGFALAGSSSPVASLLLSLLGLIGTLFINLIRMTVIPLVLAILIQSIGGTAGTVPVGRTGIRAAVVAVGLLIAAAALSVAVAAPVFSRITIDETAALALRGPAGATPAATSAQSGAPALQQWLIDLVPANVVRAAADGAMLPLIVFAIFFALALARTPDAARAAVLRVAEGVADAMQRIVTWILAVAPVGVFALAVPLAARLGLAAAGAVVAYVVVVVAMTIIVGAVLLYPVAIVLGGWLPGRFATFCAPAQAVAFASRSSLAALPAMLEGAERARLDPIAARFVLPVAASVFRVGAAVAQPIGALFLARLYGVPLGPVQLAAIGMTAVLTSFAVPGIPGGSIVAAVPVLAAANLPLEGVGILLAVDAVPDMFRTTENVTGSLALAVVVGGRHRP